MRENTDFEFIIVIITMILFMVAMIGIVCFTIQDNSKQYQFTYNNIISGEYQFIDSYINENDNHTKTYTIIYRIDSETIDEFDCSKEDYYAIMNKFVF